MSYLNRARVLAQTVREFHPDWTIWALVSDVPPPGFEFDPAAEPFDRIMFGQDLHADKGAAWIFQHDLVELCTAVKGRMVRYLLEEEEADAVFYLDPDIGLLNTLDPLVDDLDDASILLTPHQLAPNTNAQAIIDNELTSLRLGIFNLGFLGVRNDENARAMARWLEARLGEMCFDEPARGIFVDQKWCDLIPCLFDGVKIVKDPGYNVASWNLSRRKISIDASGDILVNGVPLRMFHFSKLGPLADLMTGRYARDNSEVHEIWWWYKSMVASATSPGIPDRYWHFGSFADGTPIDTPCRRLYRSREDLKRAFPQPFDVGPGTYAEWYAANEAQAAAA